MNYKRLLSASFGHFSIDILNSSIAMVLTTVSGLYDLPVSQIGLGAMIYTFAAALTQPLFGLWADRLRGRWLAPAGVLWTATFFAIAPFMPGYWAMVACLTIGALGSGALHATGMVNASAAGGRFPTIATSVFFVMGQSGLALGPFLAGVLLQTVGLQAAMQAMALITLPSVALMFFFLREPIEDEAPHAPVAIQSEAESGQSSQYANRAIYVATAFVLVIALRAAAMQSFSTLLPKYFSDLGYDPAFYGMLLGVLTFGGAIGTFGGGFLGDHFNRRAVIFLSTTFSVPFLLGLLHTNGWVIFATAALAGALLNIPHSVLLVMAQRLLPRRKGLMGGATLGFMFASGAVAAWIAAWFADSLGLATVLNVVAFLPLGAGVCALLLPSTCGTATKPIPQPVPSAAAD